MLLCLAKMRFHTPQALRWYCDLTGRIQASGDFVPRIQTTWLATSDDIVLQTNQQRAGLRWYCAHGNRDLDKYKVEKVHKLSLIHISEPTRPLYISYAVFCLKKKNK